MKKHFLTGLAIILPVVLTIVLLNILVKILTAPFLGLTEWFVSLLGKIEWVQSPAIVLWISKLLVLGFLTFIILAIGMLARFVFLNFFFHTIDKIAHALPLANRVYKSVQDIIKNLAHEETPSFGRVVLVPFPHTGAKAVGFVTQEKLPTEDKSLERVSVFVPGTPNPMMGFMLTYLPEEVTPVSLSLEEAIKFVASCGVVYSRSNREGLSL